MIRTQIQLTDEQARHLKSIAHREGVSMAEVVRACVDVRLEKEGQIARRYEAARAFIGVQDREDASPDLARNHDRYLDDDFSGVP